MEECSKGTHNCLDEALACWKCQAASAAATAERRRIEREEEKKREKRKMMNSN